MKIDVLLGLQWGDEGKGKIVDVLAPGYDIIARFQGGPNAGHSIEIGNKKYVLHTIPSGIFNKAVINVIGNGVVIDPFVFSCEVDNLQKAGFELFDNLIISNKATLILPTHRLLDAALEKKKGLSKIGSTLKGIGPAYTDKISRSGLRTGEILSVNFEDKYRFIRKSHLDYIKFLDFDINSEILNGKKFEDYEQEWFKSISLLKKFKILNTEYYINSALMQNKSILAEGAQGSMLDIDFGTYPFVTSSNTVAGGVCTGLGVATASIGKVFGIVKAYTTRVGSGPFPTELDDNYGKMLRDIGREYGSTTGRPRRCGWLDLIALKYAIMLNGVNNIFLTKADVLNGFDLIKVCDSYIIDNKPENEFPFNINEIKAEPVYKEFKAWKSLDNISVFDNIPVELKTYIDFIEKSTKVPVTIISTGPERNDTIIKNKL